MALALVVLPDFAAWSGEDGLDREQEAHLLWLEDAALRIDEGAACAFEKKTSLQVFPVKGSCTAVSRRTGTKAARRSGVSQSVSLIEISAYPEKTTGHVFSVTAASDLQ